MSKPASPWCAYQTRSRYGASNLDNALLFRRYSGPSFGHRREPSEKRTQHRADTGLSENARHRVELSASPNADTPLAMSGVLDGSEDHTLESPLSPDYSCPSVASSVTLTGPIEIVSV